MCCVTQFDARTVCIIHKSHDIFSDISCFIVIAASYITIDYIIEDFCKSNQLNLSISLECGRFEATFQMHVCFYTMKQISWLEFSI